MQVLEIQYEAHFQKLVNRKLIAVEKNKVMIYGFGGDAGIQASVDLDTGLVNLDFPEDFYVPAFALPLMKQMLASV